MKKLKEILLVDDSEGTNFLNKLLLTEMGAAENITIALNGKLALDYLTTKDSSGEYPNPNLILLDINMPVLDGYQFLDAYDNLGDDMTKGRVIVMLTTSINEEDIKKATKYKYVKGYHFKPLNRQKMHNILEDLMGN